MRRFAPLALLLLAACGGTDDPSELYSGALAKLANSDRAGALADLQKAKAAIGEDPSHPDYWSVRLAIAEAQVAERPSDAQVTFLEAAAEKPGGLPAGEYARMGQLLADASHYEQAVYVVDGGLKANPGEQKLQDIMERIKRDAQASDDGGALDLLKSLGYL